MWIEINSSPDSCSVLILVTPLAGVWIEIFLAFHVSRYRFVTPLAGVWIEILSLCEVVHTCELSLPLRECGLK